MPTTKRQQPRPRSPQSPARGRQRAWAAVFVAAGLAVAGLLGYRALIPGSVRQFMHVHGLAFDPRDPQTLLLATHQGLIAISPEQGWRYLGKAGWDLMGFTVSPAETGVFYSSGHPGPGLALANPVGLVMSRDGGRSWQPVSLTGQVDFHALTVSPADPSLIVGWSYMDKLLYRSQDRGQTWQRLRPAPLATATTVYQLAAHPSNRQELWAATDTGLFRSRDLGQTWTLVRAGAYTAVAFGPTPAQLAAYELGQGLLLSGDGGATWRQTGFLAAEGDAVANVAFHPQDPRALAVGTFRQDLRLSTDGGASWQALAVQGRVLR